MSWREPPLGSDFNVLNLHLCMQIRIWTYVEVSLSVRRPRLESLFENQKVQAFVDGESRNGFFFTYSILYRFHVSQVPKSSTVSLRTERREREREMKTRGHHKKSLSTPVPASESEFIEPSSQSNSTDLYVSFGSTGKISVRRFSNVVSSVTSQINQIQHL